jgi:hypothetical protein
VLRRKLPKSEVNLDCSSKETRVNRLACSRIRHLGEIRCDRVKTLEVPKSRVHSDHSQKETCVRRSACSRVRRSGELGCASVEYPKAPKPKASKPKNRSGVA